MKILLVYDCVYPGSLGGVEHRNHGLAKALAERGHAPTIAGWLSGPDHPPPGATTLPMAHRAPIHDGTGKRSTFASLRFALAAARLPVGSYDVIETANIPYLHIPTLAIRCALARKPLVVTWYEFFGPHWRSYQGPAVAFAYRATEWLCAKIGRVNASSALTAERLQQARHERRHGSVPVIACGVWLRDIREALEAPAPDAPPLLYAGRLIAEKRVDLLLAAVARMRCSAASADGLLLGIVGDGPERRTLETLAESLGISERVRFYGHLPSISDMWKLLAGGRIAVQPSAREGFGLFPLEAMALGRPVVICEAPNSAVGAIIRDNVEGRCVAADAQSLAAALDELMEDDAVWRRMSEAGQCRAKLYDWPVVAEQFEHFVLALASPKMQRPMRPNKIPKV